MQAHFLKNFSKSNKRYDRLQDSSVSNTENTALNIPNLVNLSNIVNIVIFVKIPIDITFMDIISHMLHIDKLENFNYLTET